MFIVIEGIDGAGKGRQRTELVKYLTDKVKLLHTIDFPDHNSILYKNLIHPAIQEEIEISNSSLFISYALDQLLWQQKISPSKNSKDIYFIADGYFTTNIVYQCILEKSVSIEKALNFANDFGIIKPDIILYLDVDPKIAIQRKTDEEGHEEGLDIYERSLEKQKILSDGFKKMVKQQIFGKWIELDGNDKVEIVSERIVSILKQFKII